VFFAFGSEPGAKPLAKALRQVESLAVPDQPNDVPRAVEDGAAVLATSEVLLHAAAQFGVNVTLDVVRDFAPYFDATDFDHGQTVLPVPTLNAPQLRQELLLRNVG